jgi:hypothetical protein
VLHLACCFLQIIDGDEKLQTMHDAAEKYSPQTEVVFKYLQVGGGGGQGAELWVTGSP